MTPAFCLVTTTQVEMVCCTALENFLIRLRTLCKSIREVKKDGDGKYYKKIKGKGCKITVKAHEITEKERLACATNTALP